MRKLDVRLTSNGGSRNLFLGTKLSYPIKRRKKPENRLRETPEGEARIEGEAEKRRRRDFGGELAVSPFP